MPAASHHPETEIVEYVTVTVGDQLFGLPIAQVQDVFVPGRLTPVPTAPEEFAGVLNLRGRIVTAIDMRVRLGMPRRDDRSAAMAIGIESDGESYGLLVDTIGEVLKLAAADRQPVPANLDGRLSRVSAGIHRLEDELLVVLDVQRLLDIQPAVKAA
jgi:purine-binding chemotaxis protein CheW